MAQKPFMIEIETERVQCAIFFADRPMQFFLPCKCTFCQQETLFFFFPVNAITVAIFRRKTKRSLFFLACKDEKRYQVLLLSSAGWLFLVLLALLRLSSFFFSSVRLRRCGSIFTAATLACEIRGRRRRKKRERGRI